MSSSKIRGVRLPDQLLNELVKRERAGFRGSMSAAIREALERYFEILADGRRSVRERFDEQDCANLLALANGTMFEGSSLRGLLWNAQDAVDEDVPYPDALPALREKLTQLSIAEHAALVDACERWWHTHARGVRVEPSALLELGERE